MPEQPELSFEDALARLEAIVERLESGEPTLEESLALFEEAVALRKACVEKLDRAEAKIKQLAEGAGGEVAEEEFEPAE